jgi:hypothetical protein
MTMKREREREREACWKLHGCELSWWESPTHVWQCTSLDACPVPSQHPYEQLLGHPVVCMHGADGQFDCSMATSPVQCTGPASPVLACYYFKAV